MKTKLFVTAAFLAATVQAQVVVDLRTGVIHDLATTPLPTRATTTYTNSYMKVTVARNPVACPLTPFTALVEVNLKPAATGSAAAPPEMKRAFIDVDFLSPATNPNETIPSGWVTHIGDDPQNDGYGGGTTLDGIAEAHITNQQFLVYSSGLQVGVVQNLVAQDMQLENGSVRFEVANQFIAWGQPRNILESTQAKKLFAFPDARGDNRLFAAFNRVISGRSDRTGCGAARAIIQLEAQ